MTKKLIALAVCGLAIGCTPENMLTPTIPATPPAKLTTKLPESKSEQRVKAPVTPNSITSQNARERIVELESELELDAKTPPLKP